MRGEYTFGFEAIEFAEELPPRARRIRAIDWDGEYENGTTSACAENTYITQKLGKHAGNYLRVRGEYPRTPHPREEPLELPPRARRILMKDDGVHLLVGTTSACAENTKRSRSFLG